MTGKKTYQAGRLILSIVYLVGIIGLSLQDYRDDFLKLTPLNLWLSAGLLIYFTDQAQSKFYLWVSLVAMGGFFVEMLGVKTGFPFGDYHYGDTLGYKVNDIPITIGLNWVIMTMGAVFIFSPLKTGGLIKAVLAASLMTAVDVLIEPVAIALDFWSWEGSAIPWSNYMAWWVISFGFAYAFYSMKAGATNKIAPYLFLLQVIFFLVLNFTI